MCGVSMVGRSFEKINATIHVRLVVVAPYIDLWLRTSASLE